MRRVIRRNLSDISMRKLAKEQRSANRKHQDGTLDVKSEWKRARHNKPLIEALSILRIMAGNRERCMYCGDSYGTDIEHFWPKSPYPDKMFIWSNMLLCCSCCGSKKGEKFPLVNDQPLLIDPSVDDPWDFLEFDPDTGNIVARYITDIHNYTMKGIKTVEVLELDRREAMAKGCKRAFRHMKRCVEEALKESDIDATSLFHKLSEEDDYGLLGWCFDGSGCQVSPFAELQMHHPSVWEACLQAYRES